MGQLILVGKTYIDSNVIIRMVEAQTTMTEGQKALVRKITDEEITAVTSELTLSECLVKPLADDDLPLVILYQKILTYGTGFAPTPIDRNILIGAARVRANRTIKLPDAIHLATALIEGCSTFVTNDRRLASAWNGDTIFWESLT